jgi:hydroxymethylbilane synthase
LIAARAPSLLALPAGATVGTASLRRQAQVLRLRPDLKVRLLRGNVGSRLRRVEAGEYDATLLALAGLNRLEMAHHATAILDTHDFLPAVGQGAIALVARTADAATLDLAAATLDSATTAALACERAFLTVLDGSCRTPIAGYATVAHGIVAFQGEVLAPDGSDAVTIKAEGPADDAAFVGKSAGRSLLAKGSKVTDALLSGHAAPPDEA